MRAREPGETRDFREDVDEMGDNTQDTEIGLTTEYVTDPPEDRVIEEPRQSQDGLSITEHDRGLARSDEEERPHPETSAESDAVNPTRRP